MRQMIRERVLSELFLNGLTRDNTCRRVLRRKPSKHGEPVIAFRASTINLWLIGGSMPKGK